MVGGGTLGKKHGFPEWMLQFAQEALRHEGARKIEYKVEACRHAAIGIGGCEQRRHVLGAYAGRQVIEHLWRAAHHSVAASGIDVDGWSGVRREHMVSGTD